MNVLIVEHVRDLAMLWARFLVRRGLRVTITGTGEAAIAALDAERFDSVVLDLTLADGSALTVADYATLRSPEIAIITVTRQSFFADASVFDLMPNARGILRCPVDPGDLTAMVEHFGEGERQRRATA